MNEQRVLLVPIDEFGIDRLALAALVDTAQRLDRAVLGLLLESPRLQQVAALPFTTEVTLSGARERDFRGDEFRAHGSRAVAEARRLLTELAGQRRVTLRFEYCVGERLSAVLSRDGNLDIFLPRRAGEAAPRSPGALPDAPERIGLVLGGGAGDTGVIAAANALARHGRRRELYLLSNRLPPPEMLQALDTSDARLYCHPHMTLEPDALLKLIRQSGYALLIIPRQALSGIGAGELERAMDAAAGQVLLVS
jgi:hypothetical protein